jgi:hypothetical protein
MSVTKIDALSSEQIAAFTTTQLSALLPAKLYAVLT